MPDIKLAVIHPSLASEACIVASEHVCTDPAILQARIDALRGDGEWIPAFNRVEYRAVQVLFVGWPAPARYGDPPADVVNCDWIVIDGRQWCRNAPVLFGVPGLEEFFTELKSRMPSGGPGHAGWAP